MSVDVYRDGRGLMTTTKSMNQRKRCEGCKEKFAFVIQKNDGKWYCDKCAGSDGGLIVMADGSEE